MEGAGEEQEGGADEFYPEEEAIRGLLQAVCTALIDKGNLSDDNAFRDAADFCAEFSNDIYQPNRNEIEAEIRSLKDERKKKNKDYGESSVRIRAALHHVENIIEEATLASKLAGNTEDVYNICNTIVKRCSAQKKSLDSMLEKLRSSSGPSQVSAIDTKASQILEKWISDAPWQSEEPGLSKITKAGEETNAVTEDEAKVDSDCSEDETKEDHEEKSDTEETNDSEEAKVDAEDKAKEDPEEKSDGTIRNNGVDNFDEEKSEGDYENDGDSSSDYDESQQKGRVSKKDSRCTKSNNTNEESSAEGRVARKAKQSNNEAAHDSDERETQLATLSDEYERVAASFPNTKAGTGGIVGASTSCQLAFLLKMESAINSLNVVEIVSISNNFITVLETNSAIIEAYAVKKGLDATNRRQKLIPLHARSTFGSIAKSCEQSQNAVPGTLPASTKAFLEKAKTAIKRPDRFAALGNTTSNILSNLSNGSIGFCVYWDLSMSELYSDLSGDDTYEELIGNSSNLAAEIRPGEPFDENMKVIAFMQTFLAPALAADGEMEKKALVVAYEIKKYTTETSSPIRRRKICDSFKKGEAKRSNGESDEGADDYCAGTSDDCANRRRQVIAIVFYLLLQDNIKRRLPSGWFEHSMTRYLLCCAPSRLTEMLPITFFETQHHDQGTHYNRMEKVSKSYKSNSDKRNVVIESERQLVSLKELLIFD